MKYPTRLGKMMLGILIASFGVYLSIQANIGLSPWDAFAVGLSRVVGVSVGMANNLISLLCLLIAFFMREKIGLAAVMNMFFVGIFLDVFFALQLVAPCTSFGWGLALLLLGQVLISLGTFFYLTAAFGGGPRDALSIGLGKRLRRVPVGVMRAMVDSCALLAGWLLQAKIGIGTAVAAIGLGLLMQLTFRIFHFDIAAVQNESLLDTARNIGAGLRRAGAIKTK